MKIPLKGRPIGPTNFWAVLYPTRAPILSAATPEDGEWFVMQMLPRDHTEMSANTKERKMEEAAHLAQKEANRATFFASPKTPTVGLGFDAPGHKIVFGNPTTTGKDYLGRIHVDGKVDQITIKDGAEDNSQAMALAKVVAEGDGQTLYLGKLLQSLFAGEPDEGEEAFGGKLEEPNVRQVASSLIAINTDARASASQLERVGRTRSNLDGDPRREAEIEDAARR